MKFKQGQIYLRRQTLKCFLIGILIFFSNPSLAFRTNIAYWKSVAATGLLSLFAGDIGGYGNIDGTGTASRFFLLKGVAVDSSGNVYVADTFNHLIRKITSAGVVTTLAGQAGVPGATDGTGTGSSFNSPSSVAVDGSGNVYVADTSNHLIRKITSVGVVTTLAGGAGVAGSTNATGTSARFNAPEGVAVDSSGNVYVADVSNHLIRKITPASVVTTLAGGAGVAGSTNATGTSARFNNPQGVTLDSSGNVYVADTYNHLVRKITSVGVVTTLAGGAGTSGATNATGTSARFNFPGGVTVDGSGNVYVADNSNHLIRKITSVGVVTTLAGGAGLFGLADGTGTAARFNAPKGVAVDGSGNVYVADFNNHSIRKITSAGVVTTFAGKAGVPGATDGTGTAARFNNPQGVAVDSSGNVYVADTNNQLIRKITPAGVVTTLAGGAGVAGSTNATGTSARFNAPEGVAVDSSGNVYVADMSNHLIRKITPAGVVTTLAGQDGIPGVTDATGTAASFNNPQGVTLDSSGNVYVADTSNHLIRKITPAGVVTTLAGSGVSGSANGTGTAASFNNPQGVTLDSSGNVYVADTSNHLIRKITPAGAVTTFIGAKPKVGVMLGASPGSIYNPGGVAFLSGQLYISTAAGVVTSPAP